MDDKKKSSEGVTGRNGRGGGKEKRVCLPFLHRCMLPGQLPHARLPAGDPSLMLDFMVEVGALGLSGFVCTSTGSALPHILFSLLFYHPLV